jgi:hypothetical protein
MNRLQPLPVPPSFGRWMTVLLLTGLILVVSFHAFMTNSRFLLVALACLPLGLLMINRLQAWFILTIGLFYSWIYIPGLPSSLSLFYLMAATIIPFLALTRWLNPSHQPSHTFLKTMSLAYLAVVLVTIYIRGFGIRALGSETWGGAAYVQLMIGVTFCMLGDSVQLSEKQWKMAIILFFAAGLIPSAAELVFVLTKGKIWWQYYFIKPEASSALMSLSAATTGQEMVRFQVSKYLVFIFVLCLALFKFKGKGKVLIVASYVVGFVFAGISGHRAAVLYLLLLIPTYMFLSTRRAPFLVLTVYGVGLGLFVLMLHFFGQNLPLSFQRSLSWVPFADISSLASRSASGTTAWRFDVWRQVWELLPKYWLIGRGFALQASDFYVLSYSREASIEWAVTTHNYHSGPLSMLIDLGIFGLLFGSGIMISGIVRHYRLITGDWASDALRRYHLVLLSCVCVETFRFYVVHGGAVFSVVHILLLLAIMDGMYLTDLRSTKEQKPAPEDTGIP